MTQPKVGLWHNSHRYYAKYADTQLIGPLVSVTTATDVLDKPGVAYWRGTTVAWIISDDLPMFTRMVESGGQASAVKWAGALPTYESEKAANKGTLVHILAESILRKKEIDVDPELVPYAIAFRRFLEEKKPRVVSVERSVAHFGLGYAGTLDLLLDFGDGIELWDIKTWACGDPKRHTRNERVLKLPKPGGDTYSETALQLAGYKGAEFIGSPGDPKRHRMPQIARCGVLHLRPDIYDKGYQMYPYQVGDEEWAGFTHALGIYRWKQNRSRLVIGEPPIVVPKEEAA